MDEQCNVKLDAEEEEVEEAVISRYTLQIENLKYMVAGRDK